MYQLCNCIWIKSSFQGHNVVVFTEEGVFVRRIGYDCCLVLMIWFKFVSSKSGVRASPTSLMGSTSLMPGIFSLVTRMETGTSWCFLGHKYCRLYNVELDHLVLQYLLVYFKISLAVSNFHLNSGSTWQSSPTMAIFLQSSSAPMSRYLIVKIRF